MKKIILLSLFLANNVFAQMAIPMDGVGVMTEKAANPGAIGRAFKWGSEKLVKTPVSKVGKIASTCLISKKTCVTIAAGAGTLAYLYDHPEVVDHYLQQHPDKYDEVQRYFNFRKSQAKTTEQIDKYEQAEDDIGVTARTLVEQLDIENNDVDWNSIKSQLATLANLLDQKQNLNDYSKQCSIQYAEQMVTMNSAEFNQTINIYLPKDNNGQAVFFNFDKYENLKSERKKMESDHVPSYKALEWFFVNKGVLPKNPTKQSKLNKNATAINLPYSTHRNNRTTGEKNVILAEEDGKNSISLRNATLKDFATILWIEHGDKQNSQKLVEAFIQMYIRNKLLCLYDLDNNSGLSYQQGYQNLKNFDVNSIFK